MKCSFVVNDNEIKYGMIKKIFSHADASEIEEWRDGDRHQLTVKCDTFSVHGKMLVNNIKRVDELYGNDEDVEVYYE